MSYSVLTHAYIVQYSLLHTKAIWHSQLLLGYKPVQHVTVLNTVGNCNTMVSIVILYYIVILQSYGNTIIYAVHHLPRCHYAANDCTFRSVMTYHLIFMTLGTFRIVESSTHAYSNKALQYLISLS